MPGPASASTPGQPQASEVLRPSAEDIPRLRWNSWTRRSRNIRTILSALHTRANLNAVAANWRQVEADLRKIISLEQTDHFPCFAAVLLAYLEDDAGYRKACTDLIDRFAGDSSEYTRERIGKLACWPELAADMSPAYRLVDTLRGRTYSADFRPWQSLVLGLCVCRRGDHREAIRILEQSLQDEEHVFGDETRCIAYIILAIAYERSGGHVAANCIEQGLLFVKSRSKQYDAGLTLLGWHDWLTILVLRHRRRFGRSGPQAGWNAGRQMTTLPRHQIRVPQPR